LQLVDSINPHVFGGLYCMPCVDAKNVNKFLLGILREKIQFSHITHVSFMLQDSIYGQNVKLYTLSSYVSSILNPPAKSSITYGILLNILFQVIYTLIIFKKINLRHNDFHSENILVQISSPTDEYSKYTYDSCNKSSYFLLKNNGICLYVIDFGLSVKTKSTHNNTIMKHVMKNGEFKHKLKINSSNIAFPLGTFRQNFGKLYGKKEINVFCDGAPDSNRELYTDFLKFIIQFMNYYASRASDSDTLLLKRLIASVFFGTIPAFNAFIKFAETIPRTDAYCVYDQKIMDTMHEIVPKSNTAILESLHTYFSGNDTLKSLILSPEDVAKSLEPPNITAEYSIFNLSTDSSQAGGNHRKSKSRQKVGRKHTKNRRIQKRRRHHSSYMH